MLHVPVSEGDRKFRQNRDRRLFKRTKGLLMMEKLLEEYEAYPIKYSNKKDEISVVIHTSGTAGGTVKLSDREFNETAAAILRDERFSDLIGRAVFVSNGDMMKTRKMTGSILLPLALGGRIVSVLQGSRNPATLKAIKDNKANVLFASEGFMDDLVRMPAAAELSEVEFVFLEGEDISEDSKKRYKKRLDKLSCEADLYNEDGSLC
jgi:acyl-coenzyme A synthetase/AMP-(fatty) acid ligase